MKEWYLGLSVLEYIYFYIAAIASLFLIVQIIIMCFSLGSDVDLDGDGDIDADLDTGVSVFTVKSLTAFFAIGGWVGLLVANLLPEHKWVSVILALIAGVAAMFIVVLIYRGIAKMQYDGTFHVEQLVGKTATVYVAIPPLRQGKGKITLTAQGRYVEIDAMTDEDEKLSVDESVEIIATENDCAIVKKTVSTKNDENADDTVTVINSVNIL